MGHGEIAEGKIRISLVLPKELKQDLKRMADEDQRSVTNLIIRILTEYRNEHLGK